jgi:hypothetical protein
VAYAPPGGIRPPAWNGGWEFWDFDFGFQNIFFLKYLFLVTVKPVRHDKLESQLSFHTFRDPGDGIAASWEVFIPVIFRTPSLHVA